MKGKRQKSFLDLTSWTVENLTPVIRHSNKLQLIKVTFVSYHFSNLRECALTFIPFSFSLLRPFLVYPQASMVRLISYFVPFTLTIFLFLFAVYTCLIMLPLTPNASNTAAWYVHSAVIGLVTHQTFLFSDWDLCYVCDQVSR